ncbi:hypothetical protein [Methylobacterium sp. ARG-1]|uniref:hypothetical protein n=1 Tax=Methylobacterium sp. ARG-1 TaxID=1692501 RepID=UPI000681DC11|nr:hypothetical protein [Methylobacterium sp. ARG-1]KNY21074.1 hypothetical protein AKJ13_18920 [Methylobacterium sp. ARG-1]
MNGRPTIAPAGEKAVEIKILISKDMHRAITNISQGLGTSVAGYIRMLAYNHVARIRANIEIDK